MGEQLGPDGKPLLPGQQPDETREQYYARVNGDDGGSQGTWHLETGSDGQVYWVNSTTKEAELAQPQFQPPTQGALEQDLAELGILPAYETGTRPTRGEGGPLGEGLSRVFNPDLPEGFTATGRQIGGLYQDETGWYYDSNGNPVSVTRQEMLTGRYGGASSDPYAGAANARAERADARAQRNMLMGEAESAAAAIERRRQQAFAATLEAAGWAVPAGISHFPGFENDGALVRAGLAQPLPIKQIGVAPGALAQSPSEMQIERDLAMIRRAAGVG